MHLRPEAHKEEREPVQVRRVPVQKEGQTLHVPVRCDVHAKILGQEFAPRDKPVRNSLRCIGRDEKASQGKEGEPTRTSTISGRVSRLWDTPSSASTASLTSARADGGGFSFSRPKLPNWRRPSW